MFSKYKIGVLALIFFPLLAFSDQSPLFIEKSQDRENYDPVRSFAEVEAICGENNLQHVELYNGAHAALGFPVSAVERLSASVGIIKENRTDNMSGYCSGTLVSSNLFLTASHCVSDETIGHFVSFGYQLDGSTGETRTRQSSARISEIVEDGIDDNLDYAVLRLSRATGYLPIEFSGSFEDSKGWRPVNSDIPAEALIVQHPGGREKQLDAGHSIFQQGDPAEIFYNDIDTLGGSSGSGILDEFGRVIGVHTHTRNRCRGSDGRNGGVTMDAILAVSDVLVEDQEPADISGFHVHPYTETDPVAVTLGSSPSQFTLLTQNVADSRYLNFFWDKPNDMYTRVQIRVDGGYWGYFDVYDRYTEVGRLCLSTVRSNGVPAGCGNSPFIYGGMVEFRFRAEGGGSVGPWHYLRPIDVFYDS